jgi:type I restriction enzyme R subunit
LAPTWVFRAKARQFLKVNENHIAILKLRRNEPLTGGDLSELERMFAEAGVGTEEEIERVRGEGGLGLYVRSLVGLDRVAAKQAFDGFLEGRKLSAHQHEFVDMMIEHLTARGVMDPRLLYESPFTDMDPLGVEGLFGNAEVLELVQILNDLHGRAAA